MPFAGHVGAVAVITEQFGNVDVVAGFDRLKFVATHLVTVESGGEAGAGGSATGAVVEIRENETVLGEAVQVRGVDFAALEPGIRKPHVIGHDDENVGAVIGYSDRGEGENETDEQQCASRG
jgi:hypothetical protein